MKNTKKSIQEQPEKIKTPYVLERFQRYIDVTVIPRTMQVTNQRLVYYFRVKRVRGGKIIFGSHPYNTKQIRTREIITMINSLFRDGSITITDEKNEKS